MNRSLLYPLSLLPLLFVLTACNDSGSSSPSPSSEAVENPDEPKDPPVTPGVFTIEETTMEQVHQALAGQLLLDDGSTLTCEGLAKLYMNRIYTYNDNPQANGGLPIRGVLAINPASLAQARELDALYARDSGIGERYLHCMPVLLKDNYDTFDYPSSQGSYSMLGHQAGVDAHSVAGLRAAGALILGKANQDEFAFFTTGFSNRAIQVSNPYNTSESPAGSSSGTGASIAANFALGGTGSDTCQSIRHPSSVNGLVGIRPSLGVISQHGIFPLTHARDTGGPMTRTVTDAALMLQAMAGVDPRDPKTVLYPQELRPDNYTQFLDRNKHGIAGKNIGVVRQLGSNSNAAGTGRQGELIAEAVQLMASMGATIYDVYLPDFSNRGAGSRHYDMNEYFVTFEREGGSSPRACVSSAALDLLADRDSVAHDRENCTGIEGIVETGRVGPRTAALFALVATDDPNRAPSEDELNGIVDVRNYTTSIMDALRDENDDPVFDENNEPVRIDALILSPGPTGGRTCDFGSSTQMGSIVVPVGFDESIGVPRGMEIFVRQYDEGTGLGIAYDYEQATLHRKPPALTPSPLSGDENIAGFNARMQQGLMDAATAAPEELPLEVYQEALLGITGF
ncbi:Asp-tRNA(Asn)/Glu-tRNA(Gln) amidotransferase A subunit family amidase [Litorivivens lipolytica]|uniref:Asp-tRNA(Asn)/Glu-tRNA(Gln) amidotransferase A subunit family amidase n=1 Tax=Litorivivens lipolytica TaxID=1524264 RepID=A0A7W4Z6P6_9GAMM|nr:amidase family protein [Litorivivens lipolytica]MBB3047165.1 Asp-tRNA(Asn)/Glu-tRNA(Gln) amidotransferase A subunit family amidase [Litorivivens lipolytica]